MRTWLYLFFAILLLVFTVEGAREVFNYQRFSYERDARMTRERLAQEIERWEDRIVGDVGRWLQSLARQSQLAYPGLPFNEKSLRSTYPWFDGFYLWQPKTDSRPVSVIWPPSQVQEDLSSIRQDPCLADALERTNNSYPAVSAAALSGCVNKDPKTGLVAASDAVQILLDNHDAKAAKEILMRVDQWTAIQLADATNRGLPVRRITVLKLQYIHAQRLQGSEDRMLPLLAREIDGLDAESLEGVLDLYEWPILADLKKDGEEGTDERLARANRRVLVLQEIRDRQWTPRIQDAGDVGTPRLYVDPLGEPPFLIFYAWLDDGLLGAVQVDQPALIEDLFEKLDEFAPWLSVRDPAGEVKRGAQGYLVNEVAFGSVLPHLRVGLSTRYLTDNPPPGSLLGQVFPMLLSFFMGFAFLLALIRADRQQLALLTQQRDFMARVTHELKTPLAGIRLMAETLELGAFKTDAQREKFARQIIKEAERLGLRVDEVLKAARQPVAEAETVVNIDTLASGLVERWASLFEQHDATISLDAEPVGSIRTQQALLKDALTNLIDNALKYRREDRPGKVIFRVRGERRAVIFEVEDNGLGVPANMRKAVFERFRRVEGPGRGLSGGHGLGLYFVAEAARILGGKVECREGTEGGARFILKIPRRSV
jgi:signal transduction histidine kinase